MELRGAVVAITGASAGIGREAARAFAREGAHLVLAARRKDRLDDLADELTRSGAEVLVDVVDVTDRTRVFAFLEGAAARFGRLDVLVNNAGCGQHGRVEETPPETYERAMRVNYLGTVWGCQAAVPIMRRQGRGVIINVSSIVGHRALPSGAAYGASKAAQVSLTEALRVELRGTGVSACSVHPIGTESELHDVIARETGVRVGAVGPQQKADAVARAIVRCARRPRPEVYPYPPSRLLVWLNALAPSVLDGMAAWAARRSGRL
jgi:NADP-dependent 3-hydroxy acid dehydrogenase YdfG